MGARLGRCFGPFVWMFTWDNTPASGSRKADLWSNGVLLSSTSVTTVDTQSADFATVGRYPGGGVTDSISKVACFQVGTSYVPNGNEVARQFMSYWNIP